MTAQIELYRAETPAERSECSEAERRSKLVEELGFNPKMQSVDETCLEASRYYQESTGYQLRAWMFFHATYYSKSQGDWAEYHFDRVPTSVLDEIRTAEALGCFDDIELWTPETPVRRHEDPMAVGVVGVRTQLPGSLDFGRLRVGFTPNLAQSGTARFFPIARWGESLLPFEKILKSVVLRRVKLDYYMPREVPKGVLQYLEGLFQDNPLQDQFQLDKAGRRRKHCDQRMYTVDGTPVCTVCGASA